MRGIKKVFRAAWRSLFVMAIITATVGVIGSVTAHPALELKPAAVSLAGIHFDTVQLQPVNQSTGNASLQIVRPVTSNGELNTAIDGVIKSEVERFTAGLSTAPVYAGFLHQLRIIPHVDYVSTTSFSITLQIDEYHPAQAVTTRFESWLADAKGIQRPQLEAALVAQLAKVLHVPVKKIEPLQNMSLAVGMLPNHKIRLYKNGPLAAYLEGNLPYKDIPLDRLKALTTRYQASFYPSYPVMMRASVQASLDGEYAKALGRQAEKPFSCVTQSCVALTFDDGPEPGITPRVVDVLSKAGVPATFFELGIKVTATPDLTKSVIAHGNEVENHTFAHPDLTKLKTPALIRKQIDDTQNILASVGVAAKFLRPPYGAVDDNVRKTAQMPLVYWNVDAQEWKPGTTPQSMAASIVSQTRPGAIILMHDSQPVTADALPDVLGQLQARGFRFVTVQNLLYIDGAARGDFRNKP